MTDYYGTQSNPVNVFNSLVENKGYLLDKWQELRESDNSLRRYKAKQFTKIITEAERINEFEIDLYFTLTEKVVVYDDGRLMVTLPDDTEVV
jgi:site-specific DNA recombinase